jgi:hypothetical protein
MLSASKTAAPSGGYNLTNSLRFRSSASATLTRTFGSTYTDKTKSTFSVWLKRGKLNDGNGQAFLYYNSSGSSGSFGFAGANSGGTLINDCISIGNRNATTGSGDYGFQTTALYRDPSAWYHIVIVFDTGQATASNRFKLYVNGTQVTAFVSTQYPTLNYQSTALLGGNAVAHQIGFNANTGASNYSDLYLTEINFIDGQALTPSSFGSTNATTGVWQPAKYTGTYGTNGFYLNFTDIATTSGSNAGLGKDFSGNANYWNTNNISVTAGTTYDAMIDSPTLTSATVANYAVLNPLDIGQTSALESANLNFTTSNNANYSICRGTIGVSSGKWYWEITINSSSTANMLGISNASAVLNNYVGQDANGWGYYSDGTKWNNSTSSAYGASFTTNDVIGVALDMDAGTLVFYKNNTSQGTAFSSLTGTMFPTVSDGSSLSTANLIANFGQRPFTYTPPTGFVRLNTFNLPSSTIPQGNKVMDATLYTGNGSGTQTITNAGGFRPDLVWAKCRNTASQNNVLVDSVRGASIVLSSNLTDAEQALSSINPFNSNGFGANGLVANGYAQNVSGQTYVAWQWQAGQGSSSSNTSGSITSTVSVSTTAGFSVVTYTGNGTGGATVGHGLGVAPKMVIIKNRSDISGRSWIVFTSMLTTQSSGSVFTSTVFNIGSKSGGVLSLNLTTASFAYTMDAQTNANTNTYVAYCWSEIDGFSKFGSYTGNGSADGPFIYTGFRPKFIIIKCTSNADSWYMLDTSRSPYNTANQRLFADLSAAESIADNIDILSNGFKNRSSTTLNNLNGGTYIYMAFAENPFKNANAR